MNWVEKKECLPLVSVLSIATALASCSVGPRTPVSAPENEGESVANQSAQESQSNEEQFSVPRAESVGALPSDARSPTKQKNAPHKAIRLGRAHVTLTERSPWAETGQPSSAKPDHASSSSPSLPTRWKLKRSIWVGQGYLYQAEFTPDQKSLVTLSTDNGVLYHYSVDSGRLIKSIQLPDFEQFEDAAFAMGREIPGRAQVVVTRTKGTSILDLESGKFDPLSLVPSGNGIEHSGRFGLYGVSNRKIDPQSGSVTLQWVSGAMAAHLECDQRPDDWALSADGTMIAVQYYPSNNVELLDLKNLRLLSTIASPKWGGSVALSPDGKIMALGGEKLVLVSVASGEVIAEDAQYDNNINDIRFSPQGDILLVSAYDGKARSYALPTISVGTFALPAPQLLAHGGSANVYGLGLSADTRLLVTSSGDKTVKIWAR